jgi:hypothetical protein
VGARNDGRYTGAMKSFRVTLIALACALPLASFAQWQWIDKDGRKVYSDQSPPTDIPAKNILRQPGPKGRSSVAVEAAAPASDAAQAAASAAAAASKPAAPAPKVSGKDSELEKKKKLADAAEAEKKKAREEEEAKARTENCARAKAAKASFDSGTRIARTNEKGEREFMDDATRAVESKRAEGIIAANCSK